MLRTRVRSETRMTSRRPDGVVNPALVFTTTSAYPPRTATDVGSSSASPRTSSDSVPRPFGASGSLMSRNPMRRASASVESSVRPSGVTAEISATVGVAGSSPAGRLRNTGYVAVRRNEASPPSP